MQKNDITFDQYRQGYQDGYAGRDPKPTANVGYLHGFADGAEDDMLGKNPRFPEEE